MEYIADRIDYFILFPVLLGLINLYFRLADKYNIIDKPNERSSHTEVTIRGGGIIFFLSVLLYAFYTQQLPWFVTAISILSVISFIDDIISLSSKLRLIFQFTAMALLFYQVHLFDYSWWIILLTFIISVGVVNAYNFMDGINGITALNSLVVLFSIFLVNEIIEAVDSRMVLYIIIAVVVFSIYNVRTRAKCFAGDIGSVSMAFILLYLLITLILAQNSIVYVLFLAVYGVDSLLTVVHRVFLKENILKPHRRHLYQYLVHTAGMKHLNVSFLYAIIQLAVSLLVIWNVKFQKMNEWYLLVGVIFILVLLYVLIKHKVMSKSRS